MITNNVRKINMIEITSNIAITFSKKEIIKKGIESWLDSSVLAVSRQISGKVVDLISDNLKEKDNNYQIIMSIKKLEMEDE